MTSLFLAITSAFAGPIAFDTGWISNQPAEWNSIPAHIDPNQPVYIYVTVSRARPEEWLSGTCWLEVEGSKATIGQLRFDQVYFAPGVSMAQLGNVRVAWPNAPVLLTCTPDGQPAGTGSFRLDPSIWGVSSWSQSSFHSSASWSTSAPAPVEPPAPTAISDSDFQALVAAVGQKSYGDDRVAVITQSAKYNHFRIDQVAQLVDLLSYGDDRVKAACALANAVIDKQNSFQLSSHFSYSDDATAALACY